jgi:hypothetical protein
MTKFIFFLTVIVTSLPNLGAFAQGKEKSPLMIMEQGSFAIGGTVQKHPGTFDTTNLSKPDGQTFHGDHGYVFYQIPVKPRKYPLVYAHGYGQFSKTWETTPDGREGFQNIFLRRRFGVYLVDQPRRGNAGRSTEPVTITPAFDEQIWFNRFRLGISPNYFDGVQFKRDEETLNQFYRQITPNTGPINLDVYADAYAALLNKIGPAVLVTHSQGGPVGWKALLKTKNAKAIVAYEPGGEFPFPKGENPSKELTLTGSRESIDVSLSDFMEYTKIPIIIYYGDFLPKTKEHPEQYEWTLRLELAKQWAKIVNARGGDVTVIHLPEIGIHGNTHFPFSDLNNIEIANHLSNFLKEKKLD